MSAVPVKNRQLYIDGQWCDAAGGKTLGGRSTRPPRRPSPRSPSAAARTARGPSRPRAKAMPAWMKLTAYDRAKVLKKTADLMRERADAIARTLTMEQGKPLAEAKAEVLHSADTFEWFAEEGKRAYGQVIPNSHAGQAAPDASSTRSASSARSARGTSRSRCRPARSPRPWPPAAPSSASPPARRRCA